MQIVLNSKFFNHLSVENLGETTKNLGYDGLDICLRPNHPIDPNTALTELPSTYAYLGAARTNLPTSNSTS